MTELTPEQQLDDLRQQAKDLGVKNFQVKGYDRLYKDVMEKKDEIREEAEAKSLEARKVQEAKQIAEQKAKREGSFQDEKYYFTNKQSKIGEYILTDIRNTIPHTEKGTAFRLVRWV